MLCEQFAFSKLSPEEHYVTCITTKKHAMNGSLLTLEQYDSRLEHRTATERLMPLELEVVFYTFCSDQGIIQNVLSSSGSVVFSYLF